MTHEQKQPPRSVTSAVLPSGALVEMVYDPDGGITALVCSEQGATSCCAEMEIAEVRCRPVPGTNNLIKHGAVVLPSQVEPHGDSIGLVRDVRTYLERYVDLSEPFAVIASWYILLTWVYDAFNEVPYLRLRGDYGSGKTRALTVLGSIAYKGFFASGASTVSPIFHTLDLFRGTLILDEADFRFTDEKAELVKILNNGTVRGFPVLRTAITKQHEFDPRAFSVFGPKIVAMRGSYDDQALESRFLTEEMGQRPLRTGIPINLPDAQAHEARSLRNRLLDYRLTQRNRHAINAGFVDRSLSPRLNQMLVPLLSIVDDPQDRTIIRQAVDTVDGRLEADRAHTAEARVLEVLLDAYGVGAGGAIPVAVVADQFSKRFSTEYERPVTSKFIGGVLRRRLRLLTTKRHGVYVIPESEQPKARELAIRYGVRERNESRAG